MTLNTLADYVFIGVAAAVPVALYYLRAIAVNTRRPSYRRSVEPRVVSMEDFLDFVKRKHHG